MRRTILTFSIVLLCASALAEDKPAEAPKPVEFIGRIEKIIYLNEYKGEAIRIGIDPRFVMVVSVQRATDKAALLPPEKEFAFAIHSKTGRNGFERSFAQGDVCTFSREKTWKVSAEQK